MSVNCQYVNYVLRHVQLVQILKIINASIIMNNGEHIFSGSVRKPMKSPGLIYGV